MDIKVPTMAEMMAEGKTPDILFWVGCAGSIDSRAIKVTQALVKIMNEVGVNFAILGKEESCTGDPAKRAGNEFVFQMMALQNIELLNAYEVKKIVTACPHCFNIFKNEYPALGGNYEVLHHSQFLQGLINEGKLKVSGDAFKGKKITYHDSCYLGRANDIYEAPRSVIEQLDADLVEMEDNRSKGMCCGAGGAQMFKEEEDGDKRVNHARAEQAVKTNADVVAVGCPFCMTMLSDGMKEKGPENSQVLDIAELIAKGNNLV